MEFSTRAFATTNVKPERREHLNAKECKMLTHFRPLLFLCDLCVLRVFALRYS